jgi:hypothetical protein
MPLASVACTSHCTGGAAGQGAGHAGLGGATASTLAATTAPRSRVATSWCGLPASSGGSILTVDGPCNIITHTVPVVPPSLHFSQVRHVQASLMAGC